MSRLRQSIRDRAPLAVVAGAALAGVLAAGITTAAAGGGGNGSKDEATQDRAQKECVVFVRRGPKGAAYERERRLPGPPDMVRRAPRAGRAPDAAPVPPPDGKGRAPLTREHRGNDCPAEVTQGRLPPPPHGHGIVLPAP